MLRFLAVVSFLLANTALCADLCSSQLVVVKTITCQPSSCLLAFKPFHKDTASCFKKGRYFNLSLQDQVQFSGRLLEKAHVKSKPFAVEFAKKSGRTKGLDGALAFVSFVEPKSESPDALSGNSPFALRNADDGPLINVLIRAGSALNPAGSGGTSIEVSPKNYLPLGITLGQYSQSTRTPFSEKESDNLSTEIRSYTADARILIGASGSYLVLGGSLALHDFSQRSLDPDIKNTVRETDIGFLPLIGFRLISDAELILTIETNAYLPIKGHLDRRARNLPSRIAAFDGSNHEISIGLGMGL